MKRKKWAKKMLLMLSCVMCLSVAIPQTAFAGTWKTNSTGYWYQDDNGTYPKSQWKKIGGKWYHFNKRGYMDYGWIRYAGSWYYLGKATDGAMKTGWLNLNNQWYYLNSQGEMQTGWIARGGRWYYLDADGVMQTGWEQVGSSWYYLNSYGHMQTGWERVGGKWYYMASNGKMLTGWQKISGSWYYLNGNGAMQTGWKQISGKWYYMYSNGAMASNTYIGSYYVDGNGVWTSTLGNMTDIINVAKSRLGSGYVYGAIGQKQGNRYYFDCSGFVWWVFNQCGYSLARQSSQNMSSYGKEITMAQAKAGSVLYYGATKNSIGHIAIYMGNNQVIECGGGGPEYTWARPSTDPNVGVRILTTAQLGPAIMVRDWSSLPKK